MSVDFSNNGATDWYEATGTIALPDADWAIGLWVQMEAVLTGNLFRYPLSTNSLNATNSVNIWAGEDGASTYGAGNWGFNIKDSAGTGEEIRILGRAANANEQLIVLQRESATVKAYSALKGDTVSVATFASSFTTFNSPNLWNIGRRQDGNADRYFQNIAGEVFVILNDSLTQAQIEDLARGQKTIFDLGFTPEAYWRLRHPDDLTDQSGNGYTLTKNGAPKDSAVTFIGPQPPDADNDGGARTVHVVDTRKRERAEEEGRRERERFRKALRATVDRALRVAVDGAPPERTIQQTVERELIRRGFDASVREIAAMIAARRR